MFNNGDGIWVNILIDAVVTYNNNIHSTINMTPVDASSNPVKVKYFAKCTKATPKLKVVIMLGMLTNVTFSLKVTLLTGIQNYLK